jgi:4-carboxymuconolactone decarboxylase
MSRLSPLDESSMSDAQRALLEALNSGPRARQGKIAPVGPFGVWLRSPTIGHAAQSFGAAVRFETSLPERIKEIAICTVGAHYRAKFEFAAHGPMAIRAGVPAEAVEAIRVGEDPQLSDAADIASYRIARQLLTRHRLEEATYGDAVQRFGESGLVELVTVIGYYCLVCLTLNAFDVEVTERMTDPFPD